MRFKRAERLSSSKPSQSAKRKTLLQPTSFCYFSALMAAQRLFCAAAIFRRAAALTWRFLTGAGSLGVVEA